MFYISEDQRRSATESLDEAGLGLVRTRIPIGSTPELSFAATPTDT